MENTYLFIGILVVVVLILYILYTDWQLSTLYEKSYPDINVHDSSLFCRYNPSIVPYKNGYLIATRYDNRVSMTNRGLVALHDYKLDGKIPPYTQNYVVLRMIDLSTKTKSNYENSLLTMGENFVLELPILSGMCTNLSSTHQYEDPRIFVHHPSQRVFFSASVFPEHNPDSTRIAIVEIEFRQRESDDDCNADQFFGGPNTWFFKRGAVIPDPRPFPQKNWNLFQTTNNVYVMTDACPKLVIYPFDIDNLSRDTSRIFEHDTQDEIFDKYNLKTCVIRCSTCPVPFSKTTLLVALHLRDKADDTWLLPYLPGRQKFYRTLFMEMYNTPPFAPIRASRLFSFTHDRAQIEFASGLSIVHQNPTLVRLTLGIDDSSEAMIDITKDMIFSTSAVDNLYYPCKKLRHVYKNKISVL